MKKVLIITYYWPPSAGAGVQRWVKFAKYLPDFGWEPLIFTPENPDFQVKDETLLKDISPDLEVIKFPIWEPYHIQRTISGKKKGFTPTQSWEKKKKGLFDHFAIWLRGNIFVPDPKVFWVSPSVKFLTEVIASNKIDVVITTGPPHSLHLIGLALKKKTGVPWLADFRDPWSGWELLNTLHMTPLVKKIHERMEQKVLGKADTVITISKRFKEDFQKLIGRKVHVVTNGFDPADFAAAKAITPNGKFLISHIGTIDDLRDPRPFFKAIKTLVKENESIKTDVEILFVGVVTKHLISEVKNDPILSEIVIFKKYVPHNEVFILYRQSSVLLLVLANSVNAEGNIPGKLFEYMASGRPILALGKTKGNSAEIIEDAKAGITCEPDDHKAIVDALQKFYDEYKRGIDTKPREVAKYSRKNLTAKLAELMEDISQT